jgi:uncharacterized protein with FMN-binding domain
MKRAAATLVATVVGLVVLLSYKSHGGSLSALRPGAFAPPAPGPTTPEPSTAASTPEPRRSTATVTTRSITGQTVDTQYGPVQVRITVRGTRITGVTPVQLPTSRGRDIEIDNFAVPRLIQETLQAQSARIDAVSGATFTSEGYAESLQSAIDQMG